MSDADAEAWLSVAAGELRDVPADLLADACGRARRTCTHHSQIVPAVFNEVESAWERRKRMRFHLHEQNPPAQIEHQQWKPAPGELDEIKRQAAERLKANRSE